MLGILLQRSPVEVVAALLICSAFELWCLILVVDQFLVVCQLFQLIAVSLALQLCVKSGV